MNFKSFQESKTGTLKKLEKASALSASEKPEDQDRAREYRVAADFKSWRNQKRSGKLKEEVGISSAVKMKQAQEKAKRDLIQDKAVAKQKATFKGYSSDDMKDKKVSKEEVEIFEEVVEYFYNEGINEEGLDIIIEEVGLEEFVDFVEERSARKMNVRTKGSIKKQIAKDAEAEAKRKAEKTGEYKVKAKKKPRVGAPSYSTKVTGAVKKAKAKQPTKKASKQGIRSKIAGVVKKGSERDKAAVKKSKFASGVKSGVKSVGKFIRDVDSVLKVNKKTTVNMQSYEPEGDMIEATRYSKETGKNLKSGKPYVKGGTAKGDTAYKNVLARIKQEYGANAVQQSSKEPKKVKGDKTRRQVGDRKFTPADTIAKRRAAKAAYIKSRSGD